MKLLESLGAMIAIGGGSAAIAYALFVFLGQKWLDHKFSERLERFRLEQAKELEHVRHEIGRLFSRISKIHEREFAVLPLAWEKLHEAYGHVSKLASVLREDPDLKAMSAPQRAEFIAQSRLPEFRKNEVRNAQDPTHAYQDAIYWVELGDAKTTHAEFHNYLVKNRIFMTDELWSKFTIVDKKLSEAITVHEVGKQAGAGQLLRESAAIVWSLGTGVEEVERAVQKRLRYEEA